MAFNPNLELLERKNPELAILVAHEKAKHHFKEEMLEEFEKKEVLYCLGISIAQSVYQQHSNNTLVFLEYDLPAYRALLEKSWALRLLKDPSVHFIFCPRDKMEKVVDKITWNFIDREMSVVVAPSFDAVYAKKIQELLMWLSAYRQYLSRGDLEYNWVFFHNFYKNIHTLEYAQEAAGCFQEFKGVPAIICAAGPSLHKQFDLLSSLKNKALIFAGGSAVNAMRAANLRPHFALGLDPSPEECHRFFNNDAFEVPFMYRLRLFPGALKMVHAPLLYVSGPGWYPIEHSLEEYFDLTPSLVDEGLSVSCFATEIAANLGCNPIIWIGTDLAYTDGQHYAPGVLSASRQLPKKSHDWFGAVETDDAQQRPTLSRYRWIVEAKNLTMTAKRYPSQLFINATEGGLEIPQMHHESLAAVTEKYCSKSYALTNRVHAAFAVSRKIGADSSKVNAWMSDLKLSLYTCLEVVNTLLDSADNLSGSLWNTTEGALALLELEQEVAFQGIFLPLLQMKRQTLQGNKLTLQRASIEEVFYLQSQILLHLDLITTKL